MYGAFDVVLYFVIIQLFWLLINLLLILSYLIKYQNDYLFCGFLFLVIRMFNTLVNCIHL